MKLHRFGGDPAVTTDAVMIDPVVEDFQYLNEMMELEVELNELLMETTMLDFSIGNHLEIQRAKHRFPDDHALMNLSIANEAAEDDKKEDAPAEDNKEGDAEPKKGFFGKIGNLITRFLKWIKNFFVKKKEEQIEESEQIIDAAEGAAEELSDVPNEEVKPIVTVSQKEAELAVDLINLAHTTTDVATFVEKMVPLIEKSGASLVNNKIVMEKQDLPETSTLKEEVKKMGQNAKIAKKARARFYIETGKKTTTGMEKLEKDVKAQKDSKELVKRAKNVAQVLEVIRFSTGAYLRIADQCLKVTAKAAKKAKKEGSVKVQKVTKVRGTIGNIAAGARGLVDKVTGKKSNKKEEEVREDVATMPMSRRQELDRFITETHESRVDFMMHSESGFF